MKTKSQRLRQLADEGKVFFKTPHGTKKLSKSAKKLWRRERKISEKGNVDRWAALRDVKLTKSNGKSRSFGVEIQKALRDHLARLQKNRCCYCRRWLQNIAHARPVEHIFPRDTYPRFSLHYWNLAAACHDCNQHKTNHPWGSWHKQRYPSPECITDFFHPKFHDYDAHIRYVRVETNSISVAVYLGLSPQGRQLCRDLLGFISQVDALVNNNRRMSEAIVKIQDYGGKSENRMATQHVDEFLGALNSAVHRLARRR
ncbi:HNH endonuclease [Paraburkholderia bryophila]|uniref:Uncharacterized protein (TIGR02646 family) n=1 Tax=Paraburkholderia bryophila TaxID=420952 RepID=A0A329BV11_9BURK|nr:hypothetical protein [Paraburkholderia bryophila]RAS25888.1 uncharacterized protein (TIGR02646 family) [Paraburkholderia bryophila]